MHSSTDRCLKSGLPMRWAKPSGQHGLWPGFTSPQTEPQCRLPHMTALPERCNSALSATSSPLSSSYQCDEAAASLHDPQLNRALHRRRISQPPPRPNPPWPESTATSPFTQHPQHIEEAAVHQSWPPQPGSVQDQSSCALLILQPPQQHQKQPHSATQSSKAHPSVPTVPRRRRRAAVSPDSGPGDTAPMAAATCAQLLAARHAGPSASQGPRAVIVPLWEAAEEDGGPPPLQQQPVLLPSLLWRATERSSPQAWEAETQQQEPVGQRCPSGSSVDAPSRGVDPGPGPGAGSAAFAAAPMALPRASRCTPGRDCTAAKGEEALAAATTATTASGAPAFGTSACGGLATGAAALAMEGGEVAAEARPAPLASAAMVPLLPRLTATGVAGLLRPWHRSHGSGSLPKVSSEGGSTSSGYLGGGSSAKPGGSYVASPGKTQLKTAAAKLTHAIVRCINWRQLQYVVHAYGVDRLNAVHLSAALTVLSRMLSRVRPPVWAAAPASRSASAPSVLGGASMHVARAEAAQAAVGELRALTASLEDAFLKQLRACCSATSTGSAMPSKDSSNNNNSSSLAGPSSSPQPAAATVAARPTGEALVALGPRQLANVLAALARLRAAGWSGAGPGTGAGAGPDGREELIGLATAAAAAHWGLDAFAPQELTSLLSSLAKLRWRPSAAWMAAACSAACAAASAGRMRPRELSTVLWALATLRYRPPPPFMSAWLQASLDYMPYFSAYDISQTLWALATLRWLPSPSHGLPAAWAAAALERARAVLQPGTNAKPQDVCNTLWAVAKLQLSPPPSWTASVASTLLAAPYDTLQRCRPYDVASLMWALAALLPRRPPPPPQLRRLTRLAGAMAAAGQMREQDMGNVLWALGVLRFRPPRQVLAALGARLAEAAARGNAGPQLIATALWSLVRLRLRPGHKLLRALLACASRRAESFGAHSAALLLYSMARLKHLGYMPLDLDMDLDLDPDPYPDLGKRDAEPPADAAGARRPPPWLWPILAAALRGLTEVDATEAVAAVGGGGSVGSSPQRTLPVLLWSVARLGYRPTEHWVRSVLVHSVELLPLLSLAEACLVVSALRWLRCLPPRLWLQRLEQLLRHRWQPAQAQVQAALAEAKAGVAAAAAGTMPVAATAASPVRAAARVPPPELRQQQEQPQKMQQEWQQRQQAELLLQVHEREERQQREMLWLRARLAHIRTSLCRLKRGLRCLREQQQLQEQQQGKQDAQAREERQDVKPAVAEPVKKSRAGRRARPKSLEDPGRRRMQGVRGGAK